MARTGEEEKRDWRERVMSGTHGPAEIFLEKRSRKFPVRYWKEVPRLARDRARSGVKSRKGKSWIELSR